jgi:cytochrome d ubiquinol oxidase subunit II
MEGYLTQHILYIVIGVAFFAYSFLYGPILGSGSIFPIIAKNHEDRKTILNSVAPFWDGAGLWLIAGVVVIWGAFPQAYATIFGGFFLALFIVLISIIISVAAIELYHKDEVRRNFWANAYFIGNLIPSILFGVALGNVVLGIPMDNQFHFTGSFFDLLRPFALFMGLLSLFILINHSIGYLIIKTECEATTKAKNLLPITNSIFLVLFIIFSIWAFFIFKDTMLNTALYLILSVIIILLGLAIYKFINSTFWITTLQLLFSWALIGVIMYPNVVRGLENSITIFNASSSPLTQKALIFILVLGLPFVIAYTYYSYFVFRNKFTPEEDLY